MLDLLGFSGTGPILVLVTVIVVALLIFYVASRYRVANANEALVVAGSRGAKVRDERGKLVAAADDKGVKVVVGGGTFVLPLVHKVGRLKLTVRQIEVRLADAVTSQGIKVNVQGVATFKIGRDVESLRNAAERFLDARDEHVDSIVKNVLEGSLRSIVGRLTIEELIMDRQKLQQEVQDAAKGDLASSGLQIDAFTIQSINDESGYVELLGQQKLAVVEKDARMAKAAADQLASVREAEAEGIKIQAQRDVALKRAEAQVQTAAAEARAAQAGPLAQAEATQQVVAKQTQLAELEAARVEMELLSTTVKPAAAQAQAQIQRAEGEKRARIAQAEAGAEAERLQGAAEAAVVLTKGEAEAKALAMRADAYKQFNEAAIIQTVLAALPDIVRAAAEPMKHIDSLTVMSSDGASEVVRNATRVVTESGTVIKGLTGIDVPTLIGGAMRSGGFTTKANGGGGDGDGSEPAKAPPAPPPAQTPRPPAGMPPQSASAETEPAEPLDPVERSAAQLAANLRAVPEIQRYGHLSLRDIPAGAPRPMKLLWAAAEKELGNRYGDVTVRELLDRFAGTSLH
jgi:flotillin